MSEIGYSQWQAFRAVGIFVPSLRAREGAITSEEPRRAHPNWIVANKARKSQEMELSREIVRALNSARRPLPSQ